MATERKISKLELAHAERREYLIEAIRASDIGITSTAKREKWTNEKTAQVYSAFVVMVRKACAVNAKGKRLALIEGGDRIAYVASQVHAMDEAVAAKRAAKALKAAGGARPFPAEVAEAAQAEEVDLADLDQEAVEEAKALYVEAFGEEPAVEMQ